MNIRALRTLVRISDVGSFAQAAEQLNMTLSAVSMQMKNLEREMDFALFNRAYRPPQLTPRGREFAAKARDLLAAEDELIRISAGGDELRGVFQLGFINTASIRILPRFLEASAIRTPDAHFEIMTGLTEDLQNRVLSGQLDAAIMTRSDQDDPALRFLELIKEEIVFAFPPAAPHALGAQLPFFHFMPDSGIGKLISNRLARSRFPAGRSIYLDSFEAILECVKRGIGYTALPRWDILHYAGNSLPMEAFSTPPLMREISLVTRRGSPADRHAHILHALLASED